MSALTFLLLLLLLAFALFTTITPSLILAAIGLAATSAAVAALLTIGLPGAVVDA